MKIAFKSYGYEDSWTGTIIHMISSMCKVLYGQENIVLKSRVNKNKKEFPLTKKEQKQRIDQLRLGIETISQRIREGSCTKELFMDYNTFLQEQRFDYNVKESSIYSRDFICEQDKAFHQMITLAEQCYENVYLDCGMEQSYSSQEIIREADLTFINLNPEKNILKDVFLRYDLTNYNVCILLEYDDIKKEKTSNHIFYSYPFLNADNTIFIPQNKEFKSVNSESNTTNLIYQNIECEPSDTNFLFIEGIKNTAYKINEIARIEVSKGEKKNFHTKKLSEVFEVS